MWKSRLNFKNILIRPKSQYVLTQYHKLIANLNQTDQTSRLMFDIVTDMLKSYQETGYLCPRYVQYIFDDLCDIKANLNFQTEIHQNNFQKIFHLIEQSL